MKVRELPQSEQDHLRELMPEEWSVIRDLEIEELSLYAQAKLDDANTRLERTQQRLAVEEAITELVRPLVASVGDLPLCKLAQFLRRDERQRYEALMRELKELSRPVKVMHGREAWHQAVEDAVPDGPQAYPSLEMLAATLGSGDSPGDAAKSGMAAREGAYLCPIFAGERERDRTARLRRITMKRTKMTKMFFEKDDGSSARVGAI